MTLFIQKEGIKDIVIKAGSNDLVSFKENTINVTASGPGEKDAELSFTVGEKRGMAKISITATGGGETATYNMAIEVRSPNPAETRSEFRLLKNGE